MAIENLMICFSYFGALILIVVTVTLFLKLFSKRFSHLNNGIIVSLCALGLILLFIPRITELTIFGVIQAKLEKANQKLVDIEKIKSSAEQTKIELNNELKNILILQDQLSVKEQKTDSLLGQLEQRTKGLHTTKDGDLYVTVPPQ